MSLLRLSTFNLLVLQRIHSRQDNLIEALVKRSERTQHELCLKTASTGTNHAQNWAGSPSIDSQGMNEARTGITRIDLIVATVSIQSLRYRVPSEFSLRLRHYLSFGELP